MGAVKFGNRQPKNTSFDDNAPYAESTNIATTASFSIASAAANVTEVTITIQDGHGDTVAAPEPMLVWLSDAATGAGLTATAASGTVTAKTASGADFGAITAKKALFAQPLATGVFILEITDTAKTGFYVAVQNPYSGQAIVSRQLVTGDYGA